MKKQEFKNNEERLRNLQDIFKCSNIRIIGVPEEEEEEEKRIPTNEDKLRSLWANFKCTNIWIIRVLEGEEEEQEIENLFEKMTENFSKLVKEIDIQVQ